MVAPRPVDGRAGGNLASPDALFGTEPQQESAMPRTLADIAEAMRDIDFCTLSTIAANGAIAGRPMSNNREVTYTGDSWFFTTEDTHIVADITADPTVGLSYVGSPGLGAIIGKPGMFICIEGSASLIRHKPQFARHWHKSLDHWFEQGVDTPDLVLVKVNAQKIHYWAGEDEGEVTVERAATEAPN